MPKNSPKKFVNPPNNTLVIMNKIYFLLCALMPICGFSQIMDTEKLMEVCEKGVVNVFTETGQGSGFVVNKSGYVITNFHVIRGRYGKPSSEITVQFKDQQREIGRVVDYNEDHDLALLKITPVMNMGVLPIAQDLPKEGAAIITIGNGKGMGFAIIDGKLSSLSPRNTPEYIFQTSIPVNGGNSGGAIINKNGLVVGVVVAKLVGNDIEGISFGIKNTALIGFLNRNDINYSSKPLLTDADLKEKRQLTEEEREAEKTNNLVRLNNENTKMAQQKELDKERARQKHQAQLETDRAEAEAKKRQIEANEEAQKRMIKNKEEAEKAKGVQEIENNRLIIEQNKMRLAQEKQNKKAERKAERLLLPYRVSLKIGGGAQHYFNNILNLTSITPNTPNNFFFIQENITPIGNAMLAYRFNIKKKGRKERGNSLGIFANYGFLNKKTTADIYQTNVNAIVPNGNLKPYQGFFEIEAGGLAREWFRLSGGVGKQNIEGENTTTSLQYYTTTAGLIARFGFIEFDFNFTTLFGGFYKAPSARANITLNIHLKGVK